MQPLSKHDVNMMEHADRTYHDNQARRKIAPYKRDKRKINPRDVQTEINEDFYEENTGNDS